jgi:4-phosphopantoate--beta-alanine ligase
MEKIPTTHPRYVSLMMREKITQAMSRGIVHETGLIAHGRGEAFDYLLGEETIPQAFIAEKVAAASLLRSDNPVLSVNGNVAALVPKEIISLAESIDAKIEANLFHRTKKRIDAITDELIKSGAQKVYGQQADATIPGLNHDRALCDNDGIYSADVVLVPLEDGDRCKALVDMKKLVIAIDLNPLSRTAQTASITIVDNVTRALQNIEIWVHKIKKMRLIERDNLLQNWDNIKNLQIVISYISKRLNSLF